MPIRNEKDPISRVKAQEDEWFDKANQYDNDLHRFIYMEEGTRHKTWSFKKSLHDTEEDLDDQIFMIDDSRYVNRPDAISYKFYGNAKYWWVIAQRNDIKDPFVEFYKGKKLKIPDIDAVRRLIGI